MMKSMNLATPAGKTDAEKQKRDLLGSSGFFKGFDDSILQKIMPLLVPCHFEAGNVICLKGDESDSLYLVAEGELEISVSSKDGKIVVLGTLARGDVFGEVGLLDKGSRTANIGAKTDVALFRLGSQHFNDVAKMFGLKEWMVVNNYICQLFRRVTNNLEETVFLDTGVRLLRKIMQICDKSHAGETGMIRLDISQENLGRMVGLSREATNRTLSRLAAIGLIERKYKSIIVPDAQKLREFLAQEEI